LIASTLNNLELLPGMQQLTQKDLHLDFDIDGKNSQSALALNANMIKSDLEGLSSGRQSPIGSLNKIANNDSPTIVRSGQRIKTLQIFKQSLQSEKAFKLHSPQFKQGSSKNHFIKSDAAAVKTIVDKSKRDNSKKQKDHTRGLMYINELWALKYEKQTIKAANIEKELNPIEARYLEPIKHKTNLPEINTKSPTISSPKSSLGSLPFISNQTNHQRFKSDPEFALHNLVSPKSYKVSKASVTERTRGSINSPEKFLTSPDSELSSPLFYNRNSLPYMIPPFNSSHSPKILNPMSPNSSLGYLPDISPYIQTSTKETEPIEEEDGLSSPSFHNRKNTKSHSLSMNTNPKTFKLKKKMLTHIDTQFSEEEEEVFAILTEQSSPKYEQIRLKALTQSQKLAVNDIIGKCKSERRGTKKIAQDMQGLEDLFKKSKLDQNTRIEQIRKSNVIENCKTALEARIKFNTFA